MTAVKSKKRKRATLEVVVELQQFKKDHRWPELAAFLFTSSGRFLEKRPIKQDEESLIAGHAEFELKPEKGMLVVKIGPDVEDVSLLEGLHHVTQKVFVEPEKPIRSAFCLDLKKWLCWLKVPYVVTGTVEKDMGDHNAPICHGKVDIYEVDIKCIYLLHPSIIEKVRASIIDIILDPPRVKIPEELAWPQWEDDDYCGTVPRPPFPPKALDIRARLQRLPTEWSFATERYDRIESAPKRLDTQLQKMDLVERQSFLKAEVLEGVPVSKILYTNTDQFKKLLVDKFQAFRFYLCWYPWIYWIWWPHCRYSLKKIGTADIQPDGSFTETIWISICNHDTPDLWFVVRQKIGSVERTIFKKYPVPCHTYWNHPSGDPVSLIVTDPKAVTCYQDVPTDLDPASNWVVPLAIGNYSLKRIYGTGAVSATSPAPPAGLYESISTNLGGSLATFKKGPFGGMLGLRFLFSGALEGAGVKYYRIKYRSNGSGDWIALDHRVVRHYSNYDPATDTLNFPAYELGPRLVGTENNLFEIPPKDPPNLSTDPGAVWVVINAKVDLMNGYLDSTQVPDGYVEFKLELFDSSGNRIDPASFGSGIPFRLPANDDIWHTITTADPATVNPNLVVNDPEDHSFQTFIFRLVIDNRKPVAVIDEPHANPSGNMTDSCGMLHYGPSDGFVVMTYKARHPRRFAMYRFWLYRAAHLLHKIEGQVGDMGPSGIFTVDPAHTGVSLIPNLLETCPAAAFSENLHIWNMAFNGWNRVGPDASAVRAFALAPETP